MTMAVTAPGPGDRAGPAGCDAGLVVLASARWPTAPGDALPSVPGFVTSSFSPLVAEVARRCLTAHFGAPPVSPERGARTAILVASATGDLVTAAAVARAVDQGRRVPPLLFFQSNHNAVAGYVAARWGLQGPVLCTIPAGDALTDARRSARALIEDGAADAVLIVVANQARTSAEADHGVALLLGPTSWLSASQPPAPPDQVNG